jgi:hypothetical protein
MRWSGSEAAWTASISSCPAPPTIALIGRSAGAAACSSWPCSSEASEVQRASNLRRGTAFTIRNFLITGFRTGFQISDNSTLAQVNNGVSQMGAGVSWNNLTNMHSSVTPFITSGRFPGIQVGPAAGLSAAARNASIVNPNLQPPLASLAGGQLAPIQPPNDGFFDAVTFIGAVPPAPAPNWMAGWTSFPQN